MLTDSSALRLSEDYKKDNKISNNHKNNHHIGAISDTL